MNSVDKILNKKQELLNIEKELATITKEEIILIIKNKAKELFEKTQNNEVVKFKIFLDQTGYDPEPVIDYFVLIEDKKEFVRFNRFSRDGEIEKELGKENINFSKSLKNEIKAIMEDEKLVSILIEYNNCNHIIIDLKNCYLS